MPKKRKAVSKTREPKVPASRTAVVTESSTEQTIQPDIPIRSAVRWRRVYALVPVLLALATSANTLWNYFACDDLQQVLDNPFFKNLNNLPEAFTSSVWSFSAADIIYTVDPYFRPIVSSLFTLNYSFFGTSPMGWHLMNVLVHLGVTFLVFMVSKEITEQNWVAVLSASLFAVHPVHSEAVAWVSGVTEPLMTLLLLPSFYFYLRFGKSGKLYFLPLALALLFLALLSKETAIALIGIVAYCELFHFNTKTRLTQKVIRASAIVGLFLIPIALYALTRLNALGNLAVADQPRYPLIPTLLTVPSVIMKYLGLMLIPWGYSYQHYTAFIESAGNALFLGSIAALIALAIGVTALKSKPVTLGIVWFILMLSPELVALRYFDSVYLLQERFLYAPSMGICLVIAIGIERLAHVSWLGTSSRRIAISVAILLIVVFGALYVKQNFVWDDTLSVYKNSVAVSPRSSIAHALLSRAYYDSGRPRAAEEECRTALSLDPACATAYLNLSYYARSSGKLEKASEYLEEGISAVPLGTMTRNDLATMYLNLGLLYGQRKMFDQGEKNVIRSIEISPRAVAWYHAGQFYYDQRRFEDALAMYELTARNITKWFAPIHLRMGLAYEALNDSPRAQSEFETYLALAPPEAPDRENVRKHLSQLRATPQPK